MLLTACGGGSQGDASPPPIKPPVETPVSYKADTTYLYENNSYFSLNQFTEYEGLQVPKYDGNLSLYTAKHQPTALKDWFTYSDNTGQGMNLYLSDMAGNGTFITNMNTNDPHQNAAIIEDTQGLIHFVISSRGTLQQGEYYTVDKTNMSVKFVERHYMSYAKPFLYKGEVGIVYTGYDDSTRLLYVRSPQCGVVPIETTMGHYAISTMEGGVLYVVYNDHTRRNTPDPRENLTLVTSRDGGCTWSNPEVLFNSQGDNVYLKSLEVIDSRPRVLFVQAESTKPTVGQKRLAYYDGSKVEYVSNIHHNYASGYSCGDVIVSPISEDPVGGEGNLHIFSKQNGDWVLTDVVEGAYNYAKKQQYTNSCDGVVSDQNGIYLLNIEER